MNRRWARERQRRLSSAARQDAQGSDPLRARDSAAWPQRDDAYKEAILPYLDNTDAHTTKIGACNTVFRGAEGKLYGFNTDIAGILRPLEQRLSIENAKVSCWARARGAGGGVWAQGARR